MIVPDDVKIYMICGSEDLRKGIDGYISIIQDRLHLNPFEHAIFLFCNKNHNKLKILYWDKTGFWLLYHRLENGHFKWKRDEETKNMIITKEQYDWLMSGLKIDQKTSIKKVTKKYA